MAAVLTSKKYTQYVLCLRVLLVESGCQGCYLTCYACKRAESFETVKCTELYN